MCSKPNTTVVSRMEEQELECRPHPQKCYLHFGSQVTVFIKIREYLKQVWHAIRNNFFFFHFLGWAIFKNHWFGEEGVGGITAKKFKYALQYCNIQKETAVSNIRPKS